SDEGPAQNRVVRVITQKTDRHDGRPPQRVPPSSRESLQRRQQIMIGNGPNERGRVLGLEVAVIEPVQDWTLSTFHAKKLLGCPRGCGTAAKLSLISAVQINNRRRGKAASFLARRGGASWQK